jgi:hypothetical protein
MEKINEPIPVPGRRRWAIAWLASLVCFLVGLGWGYVPPGFLIWSIVAVPLAILTHRWLSRNGYRIPRLVSIPLSMGWVSSCLLIYRTRPFSPDWAQNVLAGYVLLVVILGASLSALAERDQIGSEPIRSGRASA